MSLFLLALAAALPAPLPPRPATAALAARFDQRLRLGEQQRARFERRLAQLSSGIEARRAAGLPEGRAAFLRQDIDRIADGVGQIVQRQGCLTPAEERGYIAMLGQVARKLARTQAERAPMLALAARR